MIIKNTLKRLSSIRVKFPLKLSERIIELASSEVTATIKRPAKCGSTVGVFFIFSRELELYRKTSPEKFEEISRLFFHELGHSIINAATDWSDQDMEQEDITRFLDLYYPETKKRRGVKAAMTKRAKTSAHIKDMLMTYYDMCHTNCKIKNIPECIKFIKSKCKKQNPTVLFSCSGSPYDLIHSVDLAYYLMKLIANPDEYTTDNLYNIDLLKVEDGGGLICKIPDCTQVLPDVAGILINDTALFTMTCCAGNKVYCNIIDLTKYNNINDLLITDGMSKKEAKKQIELHRSFWDVNTLRPFELINNVIHPINISEDKDVSDFAAFMEEHSPYFTSVYASSNMEENFCEMFADYCMDMSGTMANEIFVESVLDYIEANVK